MANPKQLSKKQLAAKAKHQHVVDAANAKAQEKICPLLDMHCLAQECAWCVDSYGNCAMRDIPKTFHEFVNPKKDTRNLRYDRLEQVSSDMFQTLQHIALSAAALTPNITSEERSEWFDDITKPYQKKLKKLGIDV